VPQRAPQSRRNSSGTVLLLREELLFVGFQGVSMTALMHWILEVRLFVKHSFLLPV